MYSRLKPFDYINFILLLFFLLFSFYISSSIGQIEDPLMWRYEIYAAHLRGAMCNDGSAGKYYFQPYYGEENKHKWLVYFGGGGLCFGPLTCEEREIHDPDAMSSNNYQEYHLGKGILSPFSWDNPLFYNWNKVYIPYCSSDLWSGTNFAIKWEFRGHQILQALFEDLSGDHLPYENAPSMESAKEILISGGSAGGIGVLVNLDWISEKFSFARVRGLNDAGWFLNVTPYDTSIPPPDKIGELGYILWSGFVDESCKKIYSNTSWACYDGNRTYQHIKTPMFVQIAQYDGGQLYRLGVPYPFTDKMKPYVKEFGVKVRESLKQVKACWSPSCSNHGCITNTECNSDTKINGTSLQEAYGRWYNSNINEKYIEGDCSEIDCNPFCVLPPHH